MPASAFVGQKKPGARATGLRVAADPVHYANRSRPTARSPVACAPGFYACYAKPEPTPGRRQRETITDDSLAAAEWILLLGDHRKLGGHLGVQCREVLPFGRQVVFVEDCLDRTLGHARLAVDAFVGVDVEHLVPFVEAFDGADDYAVGVLASETRLGDDVRHVRGLLKEEQHPITEKPAAVRLECRRCAAS